MIMSQTGLLEQSYLQIAGFADHPCCKENFVQHMTKELTANRFEYTYTLIHVLCSV